MQRTGAQILWECLVREGVDTVFGYPGGAILPAYDAMLDYPIRHVLVRHEQGAAHMADGYARASGRVGVAIATSGPGRHQPHHRHRHRDAGLHPHGLHHRPGAVEGPRQRRLPGDGRHRHHAAHHQAQRARHRRARHRAHDARGLRDRARTAGPGPVLVDICKDAQQAKTDFVWPETVEPARPPRCPSRPTPRASARAAELIAKAERPLILAGARRHPLGRVAGAARASPRRRDIAGGAHAARPRRLPGRAIRSASA